MVRINKARIAAIDAVIVKIIIGRGGSTSAMYGEKIVASFAPILHRPKAVPANIAGNICALAKYTMLKVILTPPLASMIITGTASGYYTEKISIDTDPQVAKMKAPKRENFNPKYL